MELNKSVIKSESIWSSSQCDLIDDEPCNITNLPIKSEKIEANMGAKEFSCSSATVRVGINVTKKPRKISDDETNLGMKANNLSKRNSTFGYFLNKNNECGMTKPLKTQLSKNKSWNKGGGVKKIKYADMSAMSKLSSKEILKDLIN
ncbi:unnamed protein product [Moneuplotes crassus]|uniref:Uncharacterized protein n=1 Tax=Euplotes crassus TaxID=5936 RepID=A0AAD1UIV3_EUPCR|nr:unnamed protein product [Moneuplotes crassus]